MVPLEEWSRLARYPITDLHHGVLIHWWMQDHAAAKTIHLFVCADAATVMHFAWT